MSFAEKFKQVAAQQGGGLEAMFRWPCVEPCKAKVPIVWIHGPFGNGEFGGRQLPYRSRLL